MSITPLNDYILADGPKPAGKTQTWTILNRKSLEPIGSVARVRRMAAVRLLSRSGDRPES